LTIWDSDETKESDTKKEEPKEKKLPIPVFVEFEALLWDNTQQRDYKYTFALEIVTDTEFVQKKKPLSFMSLFQKQETTPADKKSPQTPAQAPAPTPTPTGTAQPTMPGSSQETALNELFKPGSKLQKQLEELFKTAHSLNKGMAT
jgi:hypothetical protein